MTPEQREIYEERAAIMQYCGGLTKAEAERLARKISMGVSTVAEQLTLI